MLIPFRLDLSPLNTYSRSTSVKHISTHSSSTPNSYTVIQHTLWGPVSCFSSSASLTLPLRIMHMATLNSQSQRTWRREQTRRVTLVLTRNKNFEPHAVRFISLHKVIMKQVRKCTYREAILRNLLLLPVCIQFVKHVFHSSVQLVLEISPPPITFS